jgi:hypothetical protein
MCASLYLDDALCLNQIDGVDMEVAPRASQASQEGGVVWQAGKA